MTTTLSNNIKKITLTAILGALTVVLSFIPIRIAGLEMTFAIIPIAIGGVIAGPIIGLVLGFIFGITSFLQCFGYSAFGVELLAINPFLTFIVCVPTRCLAGWLPAFLHKILKKVNSHFAKGLACFLVPILNTILFTTVLALCFYHTDFIQKTFTPKNVFAFLIALVGLQGLIEMLCGIFISYPVAEAVDVFYNKIG